MKKKIALLLLCGITASAMAQNQEDQPKNLQERRHELRLDALEALIVPAIDVSYEYVISKYSGVGATGWISLDSDTDFIEGFQKFAITPYYRQYFFNKKEYGARGFYAEGLLQFAGGKDYDEYYTENDEFVSNENWTNFGIGFSLGQKWVSNNGFVLDINLGAGRYLGSTDTGPDAFFRGGVGVGYRF
ncbi:MAG: DUF3575 domain-containing protein [Gilvibacter sp.]